jgi:hypothetical protein
MKTQSAVARNQREPNLFETSVGFDMEDVRPFLEMLEANLGLGLDAQKLVKFTARTWLEQERSKVLRVRFRDELVSLEYRVEMDDIRSPDISFLSPSEALITEIDRVLDEFMKEDHAVIVHIPLSNNGFGTWMDRLRIGRLERQLMKAIRKVALGDLDGVEFGEGECIIFIYGRDADQLFESIKKILARSSVAKKGYAIKRYGPPEDEHAKEVRVTW